MKTYLILDGYNVINAWDELKNISRVNLDESRMTLIDYMAEFGAVKNYKIIIVFDAYNIKAPKEKKQRIKHVDVVFTKEKQTADSYIEKMVSDIAKKFQVYVVTNDFAEQQTILGSGGNRITVRELILQYNMLKANIRNKKNIEKKQSNSIEDLLDSDTFEKLKKFRK